jgi:hypothetical protein
VSARLVSDGDPPDVLDVTPGEPTSFHSTPRVLVLTADEATPFELSVDP